MANGPSSPDSVIGIRPPEIKVPEPQNFTPLPEFGKPAMAEPPKYTEPTVTSLQDKALADKLMAEILNQGPAKKSQEVVSQVEKNLPTGVKNPQGLIEWIKSLWTSFLNWFKRFG